MSDWHNLYGKSWSDVITPESFCHPAKFSRGLIRHIYQHLFDCGYLERGDTVLDPFGGVALGAWPALRMGLHWVGVELEQKFVDLGQQNIDLWNARFGPHLPNWGSAVLLQGDSRRLVEVVGEAGGVISSPPWIDSLCGGAGNSGIDWDKVHGSRWSQRSEEYSTNPANLGNMPAGDPGDGHGVDGVIGSPPYAESVNDWRRLNLPGRQIEGKGGYGYTKGQLAAMPPGPGQVADGLVGSPPYEGSMSSEGHGIDFSKSKLDYPGRQMHAQRVAMMDKNHTERRYGDSSGNMGNERGPTFWSAARLILQQCYQVLKPGAVAVWVVKSFVRKGKRVDFPGQWRQLCESCGFETVHEHRAWLVEDRGAQHDLFGNLHERKVERKSFFRRLAERKGSPRIDFEVVLCTIKR